jgi:hypothetical protein
MVLGIDPIFMMLLEALVRNDIVELAKPPTGGTYKPWHKFYI